MPAIPFLKAAFAVTVVSAAAVVSMPALAESVYDKLPVTNLQGEPADLNQYKGKLVLLNFWATWCPPCIKEMPSMQRLQNQLSDKPFQVVAVNLAQNARTVEGFFQQQSFEFSLPVYLDEQAQGFKNFDLQGMPSSFLIDAQGNLLETVVGGREWDEPDTVEVLRKLLNKDT